MRSENARLRAAVAQLGSQVANGARREHQVWSEFQDTRIQLQETGSRFANGDAGSIEAKARELEELRTTRSARRRPAGLARSARRCPRAGRERSCRVPEGSRAIPAPNRNPESRARPCPERLESLRHERDALLKQLDILIPERDAARKQLESLKRDRDSERKRFDSLTHERDRLAGLRADEIQQHGNSLEASALNSSVARVLAEAMRDDATAAESARAHLERRLTEVEDRLRTAIETSNRRDTKARDGACPARRSRASCRPESGCRR